MILRSSYVRYGKGGRCMSWGTVWSQFILLGLILGDPGLLLGLFALPRLHADM